MSPRWSIVGIGALIVAALFTYPSWRGAFNRPAQERPFANVSEVQREIFQKMPDRNLAATAYAAILTPAPAPTYPGGTPAPVGVDPSLTGRFTKLDDVRTAQGVVRIYRQIDQTVILRLEDGFQVSNAPGLRVILSASENPTKQEEFSAQGVSAFAVGALKGSIGAQEFVIPRELPLEVYRSVVLYSEPLGQIYSIAPLR